MKQELRFAVQSVAAAGTALLLVALTGKAHSPLLFLLYVSLLWITLRGAARLSFVLSLAFAALYTPGAWLEAYTRLDPAMFGIALSFPCVVAVAGWLNRPLKESVQSLQDRTGELSSLLDMSLMMDSACDLDMILNLILLNIQKLSDCSVCAVYLKTASGTHLELRAASGPRDRRPLLTCLSLSEAHSTGWEITEAFHPDQTARAFYAPAMDGAEAASSRLFALDRCAESFACLPLTSIDGFLGMAYVGYDQPKGLTPERIARLEQLVTRVGFPLQRVLLQQGYQSMAFSDAMTGLDNYRQFEQNLLEEMRRAERYGRALSVILLDIDHFKLFNDTLGHQAGDALLAQLAMVLRNTLRSVDKPARYGGEEFVIVCPETGKDEAQLIAERVRRSIAETSFALLDPDGGERDGADTTHVTVSVGFATFPQDARVVADLVKKADIALYAAKASGRNAVRAYEDAGAGLRLAV